MTTGRRSNFDSGTASRDSIISRTSPRILSSLNDTNRDSSYDHQILHQNKCIPSCACNLQLAS